jgi:two-component system sensor histidine kinase and response regulator WspE
MEFLFLPGFSTAAEVTEVSGRGVGLDVVRTMVQEVSGTVRAESEIGRGTTFTLYLPVTLSVIRAALAEIGGEPYAFPLSKLVRIMRVPNDEITPIQGRQQFMMDGHSVGLVKAHDVLDLDRREGIDSADQHVSVIVIGQGDQPCGLAVDRFVGEQDLVVRPLAPRLGKVPHILAAAVTEAGEPLLIVDIEDLLQSVKQLLGEGRLRGMTSLSRHDTQARRKVLVVDDSITVREVERQLLVGRGYEVDIAVDGQDGWNALCSKAYDLLVTDIDMPRMNGIELVRHARRDARFAELPVIIVSYKDREEDRMLGFEVGANAYLTKGSFHDDSFVTTVADLIGEPV